MSEPREELIGWVRDGFDASDRGDFEAVVARYSPEIEIYAAPGVGNEGSYHGIQEYLAWAAQWFDAWEDFEQEVMRTALEGERHVLAEVRQRARGRGSGVAIERNLTYLFDIPETLVVAMHLYTSWEEAADVARSRERADG